MLKNMLVSAVLASALGFPAAAGSLTVRSQTLHELSAPDHEQEPPARAPFARTLGAGASEPLEYSPLALYPVAGINGSDFFIPYYVDLGSGSLLDYKCGSLTFSGHTGHDPYIRSFREQQIGVPVFAPLDGKVIQVHDGEPDMNTAGAPGQPSNFVMIEHASGYRTRYLHLKRGSISVREGDIVSAGTQIGQIGSSGDSRAPHTHFEVTINGAPVEPMAGPCRPGRSYFEEQPAVPNGPAVIGAAFSAYSYASFKTAPYDDATHTGTFALGSQTVYLKLDLANVPPNSVYVLSLHSPRGEVRIARSAVFPSYQVWLASVWWQLDTNLDTVGDWRLDVSVNQQNLLQMPFKVVADTSQIVNRAPKPIVASLEPTLRTGGVPVCRAVGDLIADPDYEVVTYHYTWIVDGALARETDSAARTDALPRNKVRGGSNISCTITVSDGRAVTGPSTAFSTVVSGRRRGVSH